MKIQYKAGIIMVLFGIGTLLLLGVIFQIQNRNVIRDKSLVFLENSADEVATHLGSHIEEQARIALTLASAPMIREVLLVSNSDFSAFSDEDRMQEIENLNELWKNTSDMNDPFIQDHMTTRI